MLYFFVYCRKAKPVYDLTVRLQARQATMADDTAAPEYLENISTLTNT